MIDLIAVDDECDLQVVFKHFFKEEVESNFINLYFSSSAQQCLDILAKLEDTSNAIVITDVNMPNLSGVELSSIINKNYPLVKIYLLTAYNKNNIQGIEDLKIDGFIQKPINFYDLKKIIFKKDSL